MNFKSTLSLLTVALVAFSAPVVQAQVDVQLNLRYIDPADESLGGEWDLLAQSDATMGLAGLRVVLDGITGVTGVDMGTITPNSDAFDDVTSVFGFQPFGSGVEIVAGDDFAGALLTGVGTGSGASNVASDDLFPGNSPIWDNSALLASGTFGATRPAFLEVNSANGNLMPGSGVFALANEFNVAGTDAVLAAVGLTSVRGDGVSSDGLLLGDADRNGSVLIGDLNVLLSNFNGAGAGGGTWDLGDFDSSSTTVIGDLNLLLTNFNSSSNPPALSASTTGVPEPSAIALLSLGTAMLLSLRRNRLFS